ncbi:MULTISPECIES: hypothetical protein [Staphylococcus]|uniref:hypothetical protein n=1 Tax=Staphylococcus TaxID=1279 RepID=UPI0021D09255|nr:hypothetical protein [Staphylococcus sp. IVB6181]UXV35351.1 hypothetical protein MUA90_02155 [Staphylococcus sp. IVB6181]
MSASHQINRQKPQISELAIRIERLEENQKYNKIQVVTERIDWLIEKQNNDHDIFNKKFEKIDENFKELKGEIKHLDEKIDKKYDKLDEKIDRKIDGLKSDLKLIAGVIIGFMSILTAFQHFFL